MHKDALERIASDLLSIPPLIFRSIRRKLIKSTIADFDVDITPLHFEILRLLEEERTLHATEIGVRLQIAKAQMTQLIDKLVTLKIIERSTDTVDRRTLNISLTDRGRLFLREHKTSLINSFRESMSGLTDEELKELSDSLRKIRDILVKLQ
jgi:DNA-binding MarR family transcriptional regulator